MPVHLVDIIIQPPILTITITIKLFTICARNDFKYPEVRMFIFSQFFSQVACNFRNVIHQSFDVLEDIIVDPLQEIPGVIACCC